MKLLLTAQHYRHEAHNLRLGIEAWWHDSRYFSQVSCSAAGHGWHLRAEFRPRS